MSLLDDHGHPVPEAHAEATILTRYAVQTRYPSLQPHLSLKDLDEAVLLAEALCVWACQRIGFGYPATR